MSESAVVVDNVSKLFRLYHEHNQSLKATVMNRKRASYEEFWALKDVSLDIQAGQTFGIIGHNGSGKSTLLKCITRILTPNKGSVKVNGKLSALLELGAGFHPELSGRDNVYLNASILGLSKKEVDAKFDEIVDFAGIGRFIDTPVKNYSSGMYVRLGFSVAINVEPDVLLVDEVLAVGDATFQKKCTEKFHEFKRSGRTVVLVSHSLGSVRSLCDSAAMLDHGHLITTGPVEEVVETYVDEVTPEPDGEFGQRRGTGEASIEAVTFTDRAGKVTTTPTSGQPVRMTVEVSSTKPIEDGVVQLAFRAVDGRLFGGTRTSGEVNGQWGFAGRQFFHVDFHQFPLNGGVFHLSATLTNHDSSVLHDSREQFLRFEVKGGEWASLPVGPIALVGEWSAETQS